MKKIFSLAVFLFIFLACVKYSDSTAQTAKNKNVWQEAEKRSPDVEIEKLNNIFRDVAEKVSPSIVFIQTATSMAMRPQILSLDDLFRHYFDANPYGNPGGGMQAQPPQSQQARSLGSGFVISEDGLIATNAHVVRMNGKSVDVIKIRFIGDDPRSDGYDAEVVGADDDTEVAVIRLKTKPKGLKLVPLGNSDSLKVGEWVVAIGNPYGHAHTVTKGIVSALGREIDENLRSDFIQTDASINPGNSGGPLLNLYGEVVGINTAIDARAQGIGFAILINTAKRIISQLVEKGEVTRGYIGVYLGDLSHRLLQHLGIDKKTRGALVSEVIPGGPAALGGLKAYDIITEIDGKKIESSRDLRSVVGQVDVGKTINYKAISDGKLKSGKIKVLSQSDVDGLARSGKVLKKDSNTEPKDKIANEFGVDLAPLTPNLRSQLRLERSVKGAFVRNVFPSSPAAEAGLAPGDVIIEINQKRISSVSEAENLLKASKGSVMIRIRRGPAVAVLLLDRK